MGVVLCNTLCLYCCPFSLQKYKEYEKDVVIEEIDGLQLVKKLAKNMEEMFHKKSEAVRVSASASSSLLSEDTRQHQETGSGEPNSQRSKWTQLLCEFFLFLSQVTQEK